MIKKEKIGPEWPLKSQSRECFAGQTPGIRHPPKIRYDTRMLLQKKSMSPDRILELSVAAVFGAFALMMLAMAGPIAVVVWFIVCLPMLWAVVIVIASRCREIQENEWKEREWDQDREKVAGLRQPAFAHRPPASGPAQEFPCGQPCHGTLAEVITVIHACYWGFLFRVRETAVCAW